MRCKKRKAIALSFNWIFSIIAGTFILLIAIYFASQFIQTSERVIGTETAAKIISYLNPIESGFASGLKPEEIEFKKDTRIFISCYENKNPPFGEQTIAFSEKTLGDKFGERSLDIPVKNKYVFGEDIIEGKNINIFSKPFSAGFLVGDIIVISSEDYCFFKSPNEFKDSLGGMKNIKFEDNKIENCTGIKVCFSNDLRCDIVVNGECSGCESFYDYGTITNRQKGFTVSYIGNLVYGGIFSSKNIYECNVERIMSRISQLGLVYIDKIRIMQDKGCEPVIESDLRSLIDSKELNEIYPKIIGLDSINKASAEGCRLY